MLRRVCVLAVSAKLSDIISVICRVSHVSYLLTTLGDAGGRFAMASFSWCIFSETQLGCLSMSGMGQLPIHQFLYLIVDRGNAFAPSENASFTESKHVDNTKYFFHSG